MNIKTSRPVKITKKYFALEVNSSDEKDYLSVIGPFKNRTACEWHLENYVPGIESRTFKVQEVIKTVS